ncbi:methyltransferase domain-containing protein [Tropicibacter sp. R16_0]|uniref:methyltransferase domain-containing protein n=1 Tax=Tropicibacter sp. R16_0 TaxID=2821102 RepID=UPI001ADBDB1A|nr:methyltransferase domain-containing protein [Tropicibacter sp. R16_0]MBO9451121.1 methyltransferase domain-containing protein [Tropicibacter sp. R16_0]
MKSIVLDPDQRRVRQSFRRGLASYHDNAEAQARIAQELVSALETHITTPVKRTFEFGCGTGHLTEALRGRIVIDWMLANDLVPECGDAVRETVDAFVAGPIETLSIPTVLDLICSASTVQWIPDQTQLLQRLSDHLAPGGLLALSGFGTGQFRELQALGSSAAAPGYCNAEDWAAKVPASLDILHLAQAPIVMWFDGALPLLKHLRKTGVNGQSREQWSRAKLTDFERRYVEQFGQDGKLPLTYDPVWMIARKG